MKFRSSILLAVLAAAFMVQEAQASGPYQITGTAQSREGNLIRTEYTVRAGSHPLDRFKMVRVV